MVVLQFDDAIAVKLYSSQGSTETEDLAAQDSNAGKCTSCSKYTIPAGAQFSGKGKMWEYYHFMVEFAPAMYYHMQHDTACCKEMYVPDWWYDSKFLLTNREYAQRSMQDKFDYFFKIPLNASMVYADKETMTGLATRSDVTLIPWDCWANSTEWANQRDIYFTEFRNYALKLGGLRTNSEAPYDVIAVQRKS